MLTALNKKGRSIRIRIETHERTGVEFTYRDKKGRSIRIRIETLLKAFVLKGLRLIKKEDPLE